MSVLRPTLIKSEKGDPVVSNGTAYLMILNAVEARTKLVHGKISDHGEYCAIGSFFNTNRVCLPTTLVDEVAAVNDSMPHVSEQTRRLRMMRWLRWKLKQLGMPGYEKANTP